MARGSRWPTSEWTWVTPVILPIRYSGLLSWMRVRSSGAMIPMIRPQKTPATTTTRS